MTIKEIENQINQYLSTDKKLFVTSSFQTHSIPILHILSQVTKEVPVLFINTGFHFAETLSFRDQIVELLGLTLVNVSPFVPKSQQKDDDAQFYFVSDPDYCCFLNKVQPLEPYLRKYDVWITGVRSDQSAAREAMKTEQPSPHNVMRFHPMLDWSARQVYDYRLLHDLPNHPLDHLGYQSIGCTPCTRRFDMLDERSSRWFGMNKTECGLHQNLEK